MLCNEWTQFRVMTNEKWILDGKEPPQLTPIEEVRFGYGVSFDCITPACREHGITLVIAIYQVKEPTWVELVCTACKTTYRVNWYPTLEQTTVQRNDRKARE